MVRGVSAAAGRSADTLRAAAVELEAAEAAERAPTGAAAAPSGTPIGPRWPPALARRVLRAEARGSQVGSQADQQMAI